MKGGEIMTNRLAILVIALIVVFGAAILFLGNNSGKQNNTVNQETPKTTTVSPSPETNKKITETIVTLTQNGFSPQTITIKKGTKVIWVNKSGTVATVNSAVHPTHRLYPALNLGEFDNNSSVQLIFDKEGTYQYHNHLNPNQTGTVIVE